MICDMRHVLSPIIPVVATLLVAACGGSDEPAGGGSSAPGPDAVAFEVRVDADAPESGGGSAVPGLWLVAIPERLLAAAGPRADVVALRDDGAKLVRADARGRATLTGMTGPLAVCDLGSSDAASPVAILAGCPRITVNGGQTVRLTFGEAGLRLTR
jgi:hypothetical protein